MEKKNDEEILDPHPFFHYYGMLMHQQNMLQDNVRTGTYYNAVMNNVKDFRGKVVLDVGAGTGILSLFAQKAGAKKVYGVEISTMHKYARKLVKSNNLENYIEIIHNKVEDVEIQEKVDVIISEPMGVVLVHERMLESYIIARKKFLKPNGLMYPSRGNIYVSVFSDQALYDSQYNKCLFWNNNSFYGFDINTLFEDSLLDLFSQPVVGVFSSQMLITSDVAIHEINFLNDEISDIQTIKIPYRFVINRVGTALNKI